MPGRLPTQSMPTGDWTKKPVASQTANSFSDESRMRRISSAPEMHRPNEISGAPPQAQTSRENAMKAVGSIASCLLVGSCMQTLDRDPELAALVVSGHVDVVSAKICTLSVDMQLENGYFRLGNDPPGQVRSGDSLADFLGDGKSATADEASCLAAVGVPDEPQEIRGAASPARAQRSRGSRQRGRRVE